MGDYLESLGEAVARASDGCEHSHVGTSHVHEQIDGKTVWKGDVETFGLVGHPKAQECYGWGWENKSGETQWTVVLASPPVESPRDAVQLWIAHTDFS